MVSTLYSLTWKSLDIATQTDSTAITPSAQTFTFPLLITSLEVVWSLISAAYWLHIDPTLLSQIGREEDANAEAILTWEKMPRRALSLLQIRVGGGNELLDWFLIYLLSSVPVSFSPPLPSPPPPACPWSVRLSCVRRGNPGQYVPTSASPYDAWPTPLTLFIPHTHTHIYSLTLLSSTYLHPPPPISLFILVTDHPSKYLSGITATFSPLPLISLFFLPGWVDFFFFFSFFSSSAFCLSFLVHLWMISMISRVNREPD